MYSKIQKIQYKFKISIRAEMWIITRSDQWNRNKTSTKKSSTDKVKGRREISTLIK